MARTRPETPAPFWVRLLPLVPALMAVGVYARGLDNPFIYDDFDTVSENPSLENLSNWKFVLIYSFRPWVNLSYAVDRFVFGAEPFGFHLTGLALHAMNSVLVFWVTRRLWKDRTWVAFAVASLFAVHPMHVEAVNVVSQRSELWVGFWILVALAAFQQAVASRLKRWQVTSAGAIVLGLLSKETAAMTPLALVAYDRWVHPAEQDGWRSRFRGFHLPLLGLIALGLIARVGGLLFLEAKPLPRALLPNLWMQFEVLWRYVGMLLLPQGQSAIHEVRRVTTLWDVNLVWGGLWAAVAWGSWRWRKKAPVAALGVVWFVLLLLPSSLLPLQEAMAEHRVYVASVGLFWVAAMAAERLMQRNPRLLQSGVTLAVAALAFLAFTRVGVWAHPLEVWKDAASKAPHVWAARYALADALRETGDCASAVPEYREAIRLLPDEVKAHLNLGICLGQLGRLAEAEAAFLEAARLQPAEVKAYNNLATVRMLRHDFAGARVYLLRALEIDPTNTTALRIQEQLR